MLNFLSYVTMCGVESEEVLAEFFLQKSINLISENYHI